MTGPTPNRRGAPLVVRNVTRGSLLGDRVELGSSFWARFRGLMLRAPLPPGGGLWLPGDNGIHMFFMRFPIDAVFVGRPSTSSGARPVLAARSSLRPWTSLVPFVRGGDGVLELPAGTVASSGTVVGDELVLEAAPAPAPDAATSDQSAATSDESAPTSGESAATKSAAVARGWDDAV